MSNYPKRIPGQTNSFWLGSLSYNHNPSVSCYNTSITSSTSYPSTNYEIPDVKGMCPIGAWSNGTFSSKDR